MTAELDRLLGELDNETKQAIEYIIKEAGTSDADWEVLLASGKALAEIRKRHKKLKKEKEYLNYKGMIGASSNKAVKYIQRLALNGKKNPEYALERLELIQNTIDFEKKILTNNHTNEEK